MAGEASFPGESLCCDFAWAAGLFEGEGSFSFTTAPAMAVGNADRSILDRFHAIVGVGRVYGPYDPGVSDGYKRKPKYVWLVQNHQQVEELLMAFLPWLSERRKKRGWEVIAQGQVQRIERSARIDG